MLVVGLLALAGCAEAEQGYTSVSAGGLTVLTATDLVGEPGNAVSGTVAVDDAGCVGLEDGDELRLVVWPAGTGLGTDGRIMLPELRNVAVGQQLSGTGIPVPADEVDAGADCPTDQAEVTVLDAVGTVWGAH
ncbi:hypothetical protein [Georgenia subflava]|uniref:Uncharacterized protein n=1 Tax=Georgenia subflava TaxID=1622177 RepID=A0A6N7ETI2_9MICO|nr:hypothetical protein [Georgenia subflava]MPV38484.1 hypothetical protein [Georgenia subflava]